MNYGGVIECKFFNEPDDIHSVWLADITLVSNHLSLDDIYPIQYYFPCYEEGYMRLDENHIEIGPVTSLDHLRAICYQFSEYLKKLIELKKDFGDRPLEWDLNDIMEWRYLSEGALQRQGGSR